MNPEYNTVWQFFGGLIAVSISGLLYMLGGRKHKAIRRYGASFLLALAVNAIAILREVWHPGLIGIWPLLIIGYSMGYGADEFWKKVLRRSIYCATVLLSGGLCAFLYGGNAVGVFVAHSVVAFTSIFWGIKNPVYAPAEEGIIFLLTSGLLIAYPFIV